MVANNTGATGFPSLAAGICPGNQGVNVKVRNYGNNLVSSVKIGWEVNGVLQSDIVYPVTLDPYPGPVYETTITVGAYNFTAGTNIIRAWTSLPNNQADPVATNDTFTFSVPVRLTGTYTINSALATGGTNYISFTDFVSDLTNKGVCGPVVVDVAAGSGPYNEQITIPQVLGSSATNTITINGNGCTIGFGNANSNQRAVITLNGADYVTIDSLIINANTGTYGWGILLTNAADDNIISSCTINTSLTNTTAYNYVGIALSGSTSTPLTAGNSGNNNLITNNVLIGGYYGVSLYGNSAANAQCVNNVVSNNIIQETYSYATYLAYQSGAVISGNNISRPTRTSSTTTAGVFITTGCINTLVERNRIHNMYDALLTNTGTIYGIYDGADGLLGQENKMINNVIYNINHNGPIYGIYNTGGDYMQAYHNTISLDHTTATAGATYGMYQVTSSTGIDYRNNMITIARGGSGAKYGFYFATAGSTHTSNHNNVFLNSTGTGLQYYGHYGGTNYVTLANWQTANSGIYDALSINADPMYTNAAGGDFLPTNASVDNLGTPVGVLTDIIGTSRDPAVPDMGAYEVPNLPCTVPPTPGVATANPTSALCGGDNILLNLTGITPGSGQTYQWQESLTLGGPYTPVTSSLASPGTFTPATTSRYYRAAVTCGASTTFSTEVFVNVGAIAGTASTPATSICYGNAASLSLAGYTGNNIQWESYDNSISSWVPITGATTANYSVSNVQANTDFRAAVSCNTPTGTVYSNTVSVGIINPQIVETYPGSRCDAGPVTLAARASAGSTVKWYAAQTGGSSLGSGNAFTTPSISTNTDYYAEPVQGGGGNDSIAVPLANGTTTGVYFHMFMVSTTTGLTINSMGIKCNNAVGTLTSWDIYYRPDNYQQVPGANLSSTGWTLWSTVTNVPSAGANAYTTIAFGQNLVMPANTTYSFHIAPVGTATHQYATNAMGTVVATNTNASIIAGHRGSLFNCNTSGGMAVVKVNYSLGCIGTRVPVSAVITGAASGTGLATGGTTTGANHLDGTTVNYNDGCNDKVATVVDAAGGNTLGITSAIALTSATVKTFNGAPYVPRVFDIAPTSSGPATVTLYALQSEFTAYNNYVTSNSLNLPLLPTGPLDVAGMANIKITQFHGNALAGTTGPLGLYDATNVSFITNNNITVTWSGQHWAMTFPVTGFSGFFIHSGTSPLAIDLSSISAINSGNRNRIDWSTVSESVGDKFELERSVEGTNFTSLGTVNAKGESSTYSYWDNNPFAGINYYRLKIIDAAGKFSYSRTVSATVRGKGMFSVEAFPNPVKEQFTLEVYGQAGNNPYVTVTNLEGKVLKQISMSGNKAEINMNGFASGMYLVKYHDDDHGETIKITKL
jgi:hypothetical protein